MVYVKGSKKSFNGLTLIIPGYFQNNLSTLKFNILMDFANSVFAGA